jgi:hypothetical protein
MKAFPVKKTGAPGGPDCYSPDMAKSSVRKAGRAKAARTSVKKSAKVVGMLAKKPAKTSRSLAKKASRSSSRTVTSQSIQSIVLHAPIQQVVAPPIVPHAHKYKVGEVVYYTSPSFGRAAATGSYTVVKQLPSEGDDYQYRIKSSDEAFERVAKESQLDRL